MAGTNGREVRDVPGASHSRPAREGSGKRRHSGLPAARGHRASCEGSLQPQGIPPGVKGIADTGFLVAFANRSDRYHVWAVTVAEGVTEPLLTCEAVLAETAFHLESASLVLAM